MTCVKTGSLDQVAVEFYVSKGASKEPPATHSSRQRIDCHIAHPSKGPIRSLHSVEGRIILASKGEKDRIGYAYLLELQLLVSSSVIQKYIPSVMIIYRISMPRQCRLRR